MAKVSSPNTASRASLTASVLALAGTHSFLLAAITWWISLRLLRLISLAGKYFADITGGLRVLIVWMQAEVTVMDTGVTLVEVQMTVMETELIVMEM